MNNRLLKTGFVLTLVLGFGSSCMSAYKKSVGADTQQVYSKVFATDINTAWQSVLDSFKSIRLDVSNRESGLVQTRWQDNTAERNFSDGDGLTFPYMKAQFRFKVTLSKGIYKNTEAVKVTVLKEQLVKRDVLEDYRPLESDSLEEKTLLYRIGRIIYLKMKMAKLEEDRLNQQIQQASSAPGPALDSAAPPSTGVPAKETMVPPPPEMTPDSDMDP